MKLKASRSILSFIAIAGLFLSASSGFADSILRSAGDFALLGGTKIEGTGVAGTVIRSGNVGLSPGATTGITGFPPAVIVNGRIVGTGPVTAQARRDLIKARVGLAGMAANATMSTVDLGGKTLAPGVYKFDSDATLTGDLVLDGRGRNNAFWVFQIGTALTTTANSTVRVINRGSNGGRDYGIFWNCGSAINIGGNNEIAGLYLAGTSITFGSGSDGDGRALALAAISLDDNQLNVRGGPGGSDWSGGLMFDRSGAVVPVEKLSFSYFGKRVRSIRQAHGIVKGRASPNATIVQWRVKNGKWRHVRISRNGRWTVRARPLSLGSNRLDLRVLGADGSRTAIKRLTIRRLASFQSRTSGVLRAIK